MRPIHVANDLNAPSETAERRRSFAPYGWPLGLSRDEAAAMIGIGTTLFDEMVQDGRMPRPKRINTRVVWDRDMVAMAFKALPDDNRHDDVYDRPAV
jgi:predicted DNA-binding transcriptional regulator AlpA